MLNGRLLPLTGLLAIASTAPAIAAPPQSIAVAAAPKAPVVDGNLAEWGRDGWIRIPVKPAAPAQERARLGLQGDDRNRAGDIAVEVKAVAAGGRIYIAARWPDDAPDTTYKGWEWDGSRYAESAARDDMFAFRFHMDGDFDRSMLSGKHYKVDVWVWSAGRSNAQGLAEDMWHEFSTQEIENAAEYSVQGVGKVYVKKHRDAGEPILKSVRRPKTQEAQRLESVEANPKAAGSTTDVQAKGAWKGGYWSLEFSRKLDTGNPDDKAFVAGNRTTAQIAVFNRAGDEHKSISEPLILDFGKLR